ncbi:EF_hand domain-containing protein [Hexamita inflata]|uniref:EF_hand domain-containing protein n=1 Tax=Hexamita inflata TaxID=28002 RepID=A0ABP1HQY5_9EUKA
MGGKTSQLEQSIASKDQLVKIPVFEFKKPDNKACARAFEDVIPVNDYISIDQAIIALKALHITTDASSIQTILSFWGLPDDVPLTLVQFTHLAYIFMNAGISEREKVVFLVMDTNFSATMDSSEFNVLLTKLGIIVDRVQLQSLVSEIADKNDHTTMSYERFCEILKRILSPITPKLKRVTTFKKPNREEVNQMFKKFDVDGNGKLDPNEVLAMFNMLGRPLTKEELVRVLALTDQDTDANLNLDEFYHLMYIIINADIKEKEKVIFLMTDTDCGGTVDKTELHELLDKLQIDAPQATLDLLVKEIADEEDGTLSYDMFMTLLKKLQE